MPYAYTKVMHQLAAMGSPVHKDKAISSGHILTLRMGGTAKAGPIVSDNGNFIVDAPFPSEMMKDPEDLLKRIKMLTGVVEVGLFVGLAKAAYFGNEDGSVSVRYNDGREERIEAEKQ